MQRSDESNDLWFIFSFQTARADAAARLLARHTSINVNAPERWYQGYFFPLTVAYAFGLLITFSVLVITGEGQPALLYLAPTCLTAMFIVGRKEIKELWGDSRTLRLADKLKRKCEKNWARQRMQRQIMKKRRERAGYVNNNDGPGPDSAPGRQQMDRSSDTRGRGAGRTQAGRGAPEEGRARGRGGQGGRGRSPRDSGGRGGRGNQPKAGLRDPEQPPRSSKGSGRKSNPETNEPAAAPDHEEPIMQPEKGDVCFGNEKHPGTKALSRAVQKSMETFAEEDFSPEVYKSIKKQCKGKGFFVRDGSGWRQASKVEIKNGIEKAFNEAK
jgi:hypothetical protein